MSRSINDLYDIADVATNINEKADTVQNVLDAIIDIIAQTDEMDTAINEYYKAIESNDNEKISRIRSKVY